MINIDFLTIKALISENIDFLINSRIQKIQQPTRRDFIFSIRNYSESRKLYINITPQIYHIAFMSKVNEEKRGIKIPQKPPMFCMLLRKHLEGAKIIDVNVVKQERIIEFFIEAYDELSEKRILCLCVELMGKHSNVILYDNSTKIIIGCAHNIGSEKSRYRELKGGLKYIYPPTRFELPEELKFQFKNLPQEIIDKYLEAENFSPAVLNDRYTLFGELLPNSEKKNSVNEMIDEYYSSYQQQDNINTAKISMSETVKVQLKKVKNSISKINQIIQKRNHTEKYRLYGELLTANLYKKDAEFKDKIVLYDYNKNCDIEIELDKTKSLQENAQRYFKLYTKSKNTIEKSKNLLNELEIKKEYYENILYSISIAENYDDIDDIRPELVPEKQKIENKSFKDNICKINIDGYFVYIGKNNRQNDFIVSKLAKDEDFWFHTKMCAGSHVLLKVNGQVPDENIFFECCKLARKYSSAKEPSKVGIIYTKAKYLKKPPSAPLGYVIYRNEKEILI